jgi:hypothetical protein
LWQFSWRRRNRRADLPEWTNAFDGRDHGHPVGVARGRLRDDLSTRIAAAQESK